MTSQSGQSKTAGPSISTSDRDLCSACGNQFPIGQVCDRCPPADWSIVAAEAIGQHKAQQDAAELAVLLAYLAGCVQPRMIIELGLGDGGLAWALKKLPSEPTILSVSLAPADGHSSRDLPDLQHHIIWGDTQEPATIHSAETWLGGDLADVLIIDADHTYGYAAADFQVYRSFVRPGGLVVFHDIAQAVDYPLVQVHRLWSEIRLDYKTLAIVSDPVGLAGTGLLWLP